MLLRKIRLQNYRGFKVYDRSFNDNFNVIAGINGTGKTSILDCLSVLLSRFVPQITPSKGGQKRFSATDIHQNSGDLIAEMYLSCQKYPVKYALELNNKNQTKEINPIPKSVAAEIAKSYGYDKQSYADAAPLAVYYTTDRAGFWLPRAIPKRVSTNQSAAYLGALSNKRITLHDFVARYPAMLAMQAEQKLSSKPPVDSDDKHILTAHIEAEKQLVNRNYYGEAAINAIKAALKTFLPEFDGLDVKQNPPDLIINKKGTALSQAQLSDGERGFLALVIDLSRRLAIANPASQDPLSEGEGIVLIDELELHLHPKWQREVVEKLRATFPKIQFIATTHSPFIIQTVREGEVIKLDGDLFVEPAGRTIEEVARLVMDVTNSDRSPRYQQMLDTAREYLKLVEEVQQAKPTRKKQIQLELVKMLAPFSDNPAYIALLERKGMIETES